MYNPTKQVYCDDNETTVERNKESQTAQKKV